MQFLYEGEYDPPLHSVDAPPNAKSSAPLQYASYGACYAYDFPHTFTRASASLFGAACTKPVVCPHHYCFDATFQISGCSGFVCQECSNQPLSPAQDHASQLLTYSKMYEIADKYGVMALKEAAMEKFRCACIHFWNSPDFPRAARHTFLTTLEDDRDLRSVVRDTIAKHMELVEDPSVKRLLNESNGLASGILIAGFGEHG